MSCATPAGRGGTRAYGQRHDKRIQEVAAACGECGVPSLQHRCHGAEGIYGVFFGTLDSHATAQNCGRAQITRTSAVKTEEKRCGKPFSENKAITT